MPKFQSVFLNKLNDLKKSKEFKITVNEVNNPYSLYSNQYENASEEQKKWMDKNADYILSKIKTLEKKYAYFKF
ncbi:hypothetical protein [Yeosuana sp.]|mgnify:CR=1 FL=1|uniref:hypothetical protein n=1 Tax=Yeosuana sp. TaxID=2529388 RepID=UPI004054AC97|tara:strand:+ start:4591 stop:4812 length:222 start_codon:yes stop_codon:yes gene_type:complete